MDTKASLSMTDIANDYLIRHGVKKLPVDIFGLCKKEGFTMVPYSCKEAREMAELIGIAHRMDETDGLAVRVEEMAIIFWDNKKPKARQRATVAHELAHDLLGDLHHGQYQHVCQICDKPCDCKENIELKADALAFNLLFPDPQDIKIKKRKEKEGTVYVKRD